MENTESFTTTFRMDFKIADHFGPRAVKDTFRRAFAEWKNDHRYLTDLVITLNHAICYWYDRDNSMAVLYNELWEKANTYALDHLKGEKLSYFLKVTD